MSPAEFAALMAPLGPFAPDRTVVAAVSGGPDSLALALLLRGWGNPVAAVVDHGLRAEAAGEAARTHARLRALGIPSHPIRLLLPPGPDLGARARAARYQALLALCRELGVPDLLLGHHGRDQAETVLLRARAGSGPAGLAAMPALSWRGAARLLRPLLGLDPLRLRLTLLAAGISWEEDPGNTDPATARGALRQAPLPPPQPALGPFRAAAEAELAALLARNVELHPAGHAVVSGDLPAPAWSALLWTLSGRAHPPPPAGVERLRRTGAGTLGGVQLAAGRLFREPAAVAPPVPAVPGALWDGRFLLRTDHPGAALGALGADAAGLRRRSRWPAAVLRGLPALRRDGKLLAVPHLAYPDAETCRSVALDWRPARPLAGAPFRP